MIKRIVVALDPQEDTNIAIQYSIRLARRFQASLSGLAVVDVSNIPFNTGVGTIDMEYYGEEFWEGLTQETQEVAAELLDTFEKAVEKADVRHRKVKREGASWERIVEETKYHDLLVIGRDSRFFYNEPDRDTKTLAKVVKNGVASTLVVTDEYRDVEKVMVAYDGSAAAARSLKNFIHLLPYGKDVEIELVYVHEANGSIRGEVYPVEQAAEYLAEHNFRYVRKSILEKGIPSSVLMDLQTERNPDLVLIGAHSVSALRRLTFGSNTHNMITRTKTPLFLAS